MKYGVTGSRYGHPRLRAWLNALVERRGVPEFFVLGDNHDTDESVDWQAWLWCNERGFHAFRVRKDPALGSRRFRARNQHMVDIARVDGPHDALFLGFPCRRSKGTWDCLSRARRAGIETFHSEHLLGGAR